MIDKNNDPSTKNESHKNPIIGGESRISAKNKHLLQIAETEHYRPDIDGLRALAILPVLAYHAFPNWVQGGFIGVDIFFVISGYLISSIIFKRLAQNNFSFLDFYARRVRRIFPALIFMLIAVFIFGWYALLSDEYKQIGKHMAAGSGFAQNIVLWSEEGYFDIASELKPLMHLWSLSIEEQFYLLFPLTVWALWRWGIVFTAVVLTMFGSFYLNARGVHIDMVKSFFLPQTRIWELMVGVVLAYIQGFRHEMWLFSPTAMKFYEKLVDIFSIRQIPYEKFKTWFANFLSILGLGLILQTIFTLTKEDLFPGFNALPPVFGAMLLIWSGSFKTGAYQDAWINRKILAFRPFVWIGLISYPLYLWHWPLLSFARIIESETPPAWLRTGLLALSFVLSIITYLLIERPIRFGKFRKFWAITLVIIMIILGGLGLLVYARDGASRMEASSQEIKDWKKQKKYMEDNCAQYFLDWNNTRSPFKCSVLHKTKPDIAIIGDSHAHRLFFGISHYLGKEHNPAIFSQGCAWPFYDVAVGVDKRYRKNIRNLRAPRLINSALDYAKDDSHIKQIILTTGACWGNVVDIKNPKEKNTEKILENKMRLTFDKLLRTNKAILYVLDHPILYFDPKACIDRPFRSSSNKHSCKITVEQFKKQKLQYLKIAKRVLKDYPKIKVFDLSTLFCDEEFCYANRDGMLMYGNGSHLSWNGSKYVAQFLAPIIKDSLGD